MSEEKAQTVVLLVEDEMSDAQLLRRAFTKAGIATPIHHVKTATEALAYLHGMQPYSDRALNPLPSVILLDLNLPDMPGLSLLQTIKQSQEVRDIPVVVLTGDRDEKMMQAAYAAGATSYLVKTFRMAEVSSFARAISDYWTQRDPNRAIRIKRTG